MLKPCWVTFRFLGFQSVRGDIHELEKSDSSSTVTFYKMNIDKSITFYLQGLQTRFSGCSNNSHATNTHKNY